MAQCTLLETANRGHAGFFCRCWGFVTLLWPWAVSAPLIQATFFIWLALTRSWLPVVLERRWQISRHTCTSKLQYQSVGGTIAVQTSVAQNQSQTVCHLTDVILWVVRRWSMTTTSIFCRQTPGRLLSVTVIPPAETIQTCQGRLGESLDVGDGSWNSPDFHSCNSAAQNATR